MSEDKRSVTVHDARKQNIILREVRTEPDGDYYPEITSLGKAMTEASMNRLWRERLEQKMQKINGAINRKGGTKRYEKVVERTGRAIERYPSIASHYGISYIRNGEKPQKMLRMDWDIKDLFAMESGHGVYFLRTNVRKFDERTTWDYYKLIWEIECRTASSRPTPTCVPSIIKKTARAMPVFSSACCPIGFQHHPPAAEAIGRKLLLDGDRQTHVHTKIGDH